MRDEVNNKKQLVCTVVIDQHASCGILTVRSLPLFVSKAVMRISWLTRWQRVNKMIIPITLHSVFVLSSVKNIQNLWIRWESDMTFSAQTYFYTYGQCIPV